MIKHEAGNEVEVPPVTTQQILARIRERKAKSTVLMAIPDEHLARFHGIEKMLRPNGLLLKPDLVGLDKGYDRFQRLLSLLEIHRAGVSTKDANQKFLRSLPSAWSNISLIMRNKPGINNLDIDYLYNNLKVYEADIKAPFGSSLNSQNVAFVSTESTSSTNELNVAYSVSTATGHSSQAQGSSSYADELMFSFFANQSSSPQPDNDDLEQIDQDDLEEMDLKWQVAMLSIKVKQFYKETRRKLEFNGKEQLVLTKPSVKKIRKSNLEIIGYQYGLESIEGQLRVHQQNEVIYEEKIGVLEYDVKNKSYLLKYTQKQLDEPLREKEDLKAKLKKFETSSKNLTKLLDSQISAKVKTSLGYDSQFNEKEVLDVNEEKVTKTMLDNCSSDEENSLANDRFKKGEGYHAVSPPFTGNYMPPKSDLSFVGLDDSIYKFQISETVTSLTKDEKDALETIFTRSGRIPVSVAKPKVAASTSGAKPVNTARPKQNGNFSKSGSTFYKSHSPIRRSFYNAMAHSRRNSTKRVNTAGSKVVSAVKGNRVTAVKTSACCVWRPRANEIDQISNDNRYMTGNKDYLTDYQEINDGGFVAFGLNRDSLLPIAFWAEVVNTACYVLNRALVTKSNNKTPYELLNGGTPRLYFMRPFGCPVTILNTLDPLGKFEGKADEGFLVRYSVTSKAFRVFNTKTKKVKEKFHVRILENKPNVVGIGPNWLFDIDFLTNSMNYIPVYARNQNDKNTGLQDTNGNPGTQDNVDTRKEVSDQHYIVLPSWSSISSTFKISDDKAADDKPKDDTGSKSINEPVNKKDQAYRDELNRLMSQEKDAINAAITSGTFSAGGQSSPHPDAFIPANTLLHVDQNDSHISNLEDTVELRSIVDLSYRKKAIGTKWVYRNKKDKRGIVVRNKARLVAQGHIQEEGIDYDEVFALVAKIEAIRIFLAFALFMRFIVYQMDVKSAFIYGTIEEEVYIPDDFHEGAYILLRTTASTLIKTQKQLVKDEEAADVDVHLYRSMIRSLIYLTASRLDIMFAVCACSRFQVTPKLSHLHVVKQIFRYLKGQPKVGLWRLISWQCKKQTIVATSTTEVEYVVTANYCRHVL
nr:hypothetical protein [Tanacetum cinerariifolium]